MGDEVTDLLGESIRRLKYGGVEDDAQHVVGHPVDAEVAAAAAGQSAGENLGDDAQAIALVPAEWQDRPGGRGVKRLGIVGRPALGVEDAAVRDRHALVEGNLDLALGDRAGRDVEDDGGAVRTGMPAAIGLAESRRWVPPKGATRMPPPLVLTKWSETLPAGAAISAQSPIRPRWPEFRTATTATPCARFVDAELHRLLAHHLAKAELAVDDGHGIVLEDDLQRLVGQHLAGAEPLDIGRNADDPVGIVPDQVGLDQVMRDPRVLRRPAAGGGKHAVHQELEPVMRDDQEAHAFSWIWKLA